MEQTTEKTFERIFVRHKVDEYYSEWVNQYSQVLRLLIVRYNDFNLAPIQSIEQIQALIDEPQLFIEGQILAAAKENGVPKVGALVLPDSELIRIFGSTIAIDTLESPVIALRNMNRNRPGIWRFLYLKDGQVEFDKDLEDKVRLEGALYLENSEDKELHDNLTKLRQLLDYFTPIFNERHALTEFYRKYLMTEYNQHFDVDSVYADLKANPKPKQGAN